MKKQTAFTLIELLVVIAIIGLLAGAVSVAFSEARKSSRDSRRRQDIKTVLTALDMYHSQNGTYQVSGCGYEGNGAGWFNQIPSADPRYIKAVSQGLVDAGVLGQEIIDPSGKRAGNGSYMIYPESGVTWKDGVCFLVVLEKPTAEDVAFCNSSVACSSKSSYTINYGGCIK